MATTCSDQPCNRPLRARGLCNTHYHYRRRHGTLPPLVQASGCSEDGCPRPHMARGLCATHYQRLRTTGSLVQPIRTGPAEARFWAKVDRSGGPDACWPWIPKPMANGYGRVWWNGRSEVAHRIAYLLAKGPIPAGLTVDHVKERGCTLRACQNPAHLEA